MTKKLAPKQKKGTTLTFSLDELYDLADFLAAGAVMLRRKTPVVSRIKGALKRFGIKTPVGL